MKKKQWTKQVKDEFLAKLAEKGNVSEAAAHVERSRSYAYELRNEDEDFAKAWDEAETIAADALHSEVHRRGVTGWQEPVFYQGNEVATVTKYSDRMLELLYKTHHPKGKQLNSLAVRGEGESGEIVIRVMYGDASES